jgi:hypothetical protein
MKIRGVLFVPVIAMLSSTSLADLSAQRRLIPLQVEYAPEPETWEEAAANCHVIAVVRLKTQRYIQRAVGPQLSTVFEAQVVDVLRNAAPHGAIGSTIEIARFGGAVGTVAGFMIQEEAHFPPWSSGASLLVFLSWHEPTGAFTLPYGPNSSYEAGSGDNVRTFGRGRLARSQNGRRFSEFVNEIRARVF